MNDEKARDYYTRKKFQATLKLYTDGIMVIDWLPAGKTWYNLWLRVFIDENRGYVAITGDADDEVLCWYNPVKAEDLADYLAEFNYSEGKIQASKHLYTYNQKDIEVDIKNFFVDNELEPDECESYCQLCDLIESQYVPPEAADILSEIDDTWWEYDFGKRLSPQFYYRHVGASMAIREVLKKLGYSEELSEDE